MRIALELGKDQAKSLLAVVARARTATAAILYDEAYELNRDEVNQLSAEKNVLQYAETKLIAAINQEDK